MKRFFPIVIALMMITGIMFTGCSKQDSKLSANDSIGACTDTLSEALSEEATFEKFSDCISAWATENDIKVETTTSEYIVISKESSIDKETAESFTYHSTMDFTSEETLDESIETAAAVMTAVYSADAHGTLKGIFTLTEDNKATGAKALPSSQLECDNFIDVIYDGKLSLFNCVASSSDVAATKKLTRTAPTYTKAYKIHFSGVSGQSAYVSRGTYPNPIKTVGDLLAGCQSSTILFELASFNGGDSTDVIPETVDATIVLHENDVESFTKKFTKSYEKIEDQYEDSDEEDVTFEYTMTPVDLPGTVICKEDTENIFSLMYTMINGTYTRNDDDVVKAVSNIGSVSTANSTFTLKINARSLENVLMDEMHGTIDTICGLCDMHAKVLSESELWFNSTSTPLVAALTDGIHVEPEGKIESKCAFEFLEKNGDLNMIIVGTEASEAPKVLNVLMTYMPVAGLAEVTE